MKKPKIVIFVGHFGSGKTEMALNYAINSSNRGEKTTLVDIDIINPFYRSSELKKEFEIHNIELISPNFIGTTLDVPSLPPSIQGVFNRNDEVIVFDVGGDPEGATVLSRYKSYFESIPYEMYFVINTRRPFTNEVKDIIGYMEEIERNSRLKITNLVCNTNLSYETSFDIIMEGINIVTEVSNITNLPFSYINVPENLVKLISEKVSSTIFPLKLYMTKWHTL